MVKMELITEACDLLQQTQESNGTPYITSYEIEKMDVNIQKALDLLHQFRSTAAPPLSESDTLSERSERESQSYESHSPVPLE